MTPQTKKWLKGIAAVGISTFANTASGLLLLPDVFNFTKAGMLNTAKLTLVPVAVAVFAYLRQSPLSDVTATIDAKGNVTAVEGSVTVGVTSTKN